MAATTRRLNQMVANWRTHSHRPSRNCRREFTKQAAHKIAEPTLEESIPAPDFVKPNAFCLHDAWSASVRKMFCAAHRHAQRDALAHPPFDSGAGPPSAIACGRRWTAAPRNTLSKRGSDSTKLMTFCGALWPGESSRQPARLRRRSRFALVALLGKFQRRDAAATKATIFHEARFITGSRSSRSARRRRRCCHLERTRLR